MKCLITFWTARISSILALVSLSACSIFSPVKTDTITQYQITATPSYIAQKHPRRISLFVNQPYVSGVINTIQMAYSIKPYQIAYFVHNRWADLPSSMLLPLIVTTLQQTHFFHAVGFASQTAKYDYYLNTELLQFQQVFFTQTSVFHITLRAQLVNARTNQIIASKEFSVEEVAPQYGPYGGAIAANRATAKVLGELAKWSVFKL